MICPSYVKVALAPGAREYPLTATVWIMSDFVWESRASREALGATTKYSEIFESAPSAAEGTHPPLGVVVELMAAIRKMIVAFPVFATVMLKEVGVI